DRFGRKGALNVGLCVFAIGSIVAAFGGEATTLITGRAVMGLGAALVMPATLSILTNVFPPQERAKAIGVWAGVAGAGGAIGPIVSGVLLAHFWWGSIFFLNIPVVLVALVGGWFLVPTSHDPAEAQLDLPGAALSIGAVGSLIYAIIEAPDRGWTNTTTLLWFAAAVVFGMAFAARELTATAPMLDLRYFRRRGFTGGSIAISMMFFGMFGMFFVLTQYLQLVRGWSALNSGFRTLPFAVTIMVVAPMSARFAEKFGAKRVVSSGVFVAGCGMFLLSRANIDTAYGYLVVALVVLAAGMGLTMAPSTASIMASLPLAKAGVGSAMNDTNRELGGAVGVAVLGSIVATRYGAALGDSLRGAPPQVADAARRSLGAALGIADQLRRPGLAQAAKVAFVDAMSVALTVGAAVAVVAAVIVYLVLPTHVHASEEQDRYGGREAED
ncbi:MAG: MFS transporter, partial [Actinomycetes bacterium]